jgi:hypothetical protein
MKFWHQKFLENEIVNEERKTIKKEKYKVTYLFHQLSIWISILIILLLIAFLYI